MIVRYIARKIGRKALSFAQKKALKKAVKASALARRKIAKGVRSQVKVARLANDYNKIQRGTNTTFKKALADAGIDYNKLQRGTRVTFKSTMPNGVGVDYNRIQRSTKITFNPGRRYGPKRSTTVSLQLKDMIKPSKRDQELINRYTKMAMKRR